MPDGSNRSRAESIAAALLARVQQALLGQIEPSYFARWVKANGDAVIDAVEELLIPLLPTRAPRAVEAVVLGDGTVELLSGPEAGRIVPLHPSVADHEEGQEIAVVLDGGYARPASVPATRPPVTGPRSASPVLDPIGTYRDVLERPARDASSRLRGRLVDGTLLDPDDRAEANLTAMGILARVRWGTANERADLLDLSDNEREAVGLYSGWGAIGLKRYASRFPAGFPVPEARGLVHEYYTPRRIWRLILSQLVQPLLGTLPRDAEGMVQALEPSAGIGRALSVSPPDLRWTAVEASAVSAKLLRALYPRATVFEGFAESYFASHAERFGLILANPPYGPRGEGAELDPNGYKTKQAYIYFVIRAAERLAAGGIGIYIIPTGFMSSKSGPFVKHRTALLERAHLLGAWRLPSVPPPGGTSDDVAYDNFVVDVVMVRGRGGVAATLPPTDIGVAEGDYYEVNPSHILGRVLTNDGAEDADEPPRGKVRRGMQVEGRFTGFPPWSPRPMVDVEVTAVKRGSAARGGLTRTQVSENVGSDAPLRLQAVANIGARLDRYLAAVAAGADTETSGRVEIVNDLVAWGVANGAPGRDDGVRQLAAGGNVAAQRFLSVWNGATLVPAMYAQSAPPVYTGSRTLAEMADWAFRQRGGLPLPVSALSASATEAGLGPVPLSRVWSELFPAGWRVDGAEPNYTVEPRHHFLTGYLWPRFDNSEYMRAPEAKEQLAELRASIGWVGGAELFNQVVPNQPWIPLDLIGRFAAEATVVEKNDGGTAKRMPAVAGWPKAALVREEGITTFEGIPYAKLANTKEARSGSGASQDTLCFLGYLNTDNTLWKPEVEKELNAEGNEVQVPIEVTRKRQEVRWRTAFSKWVQGDPEIADALERAYNRTLRGYRPFEHPSDPVPIARWNPKYILHPYQNAGLRKLEANGCGLLAFDVGLGKTWTGCALIARARQGGWAKRPVVVVPNTICWKWFRDFAKVLPDYRVVVIGSDRKQATSGKRAGKWIAVNDTPESRAEKWTAFQAGMYDVAIVTYSALARQQVDPAFVQSYVGKTVAIRRSIQLSLEQADAAEGEKKKGGGKRTERSEADIQERVRAWVGEKLAPPKNWRYDVGIDWHALGIDLMVVDEGQNFKNLFFSTREGAGEKAAAKRAWALDFRAASVRQHSGGRGVVILSATPMKNAATEFYNLLYLVNPAIWEQVGVADPESFISQFAAIATRKVTGGDGKQKEMDVVVGFNHVDALKGVVFRWADFKTAVQVGLPLPEVRRIQHVARASEEQMDKFGELFAELADIADKMKNIAHMKDAKGEAIKRALRLKKQGVNMRLYLAALHPGLVGGSMIPSSGPKLVQCVENILTTRPATCSTQDDGSDWCLDCGHIVFCENPMVHTALKTLLVEAGMDPSRIAILNAAEAPDLEMRQQIAEGFNGVGKPTDEEYSAPLYDVVIANQVAYEGIDLQVRTCAIHHLDVPYEPATLQQRNGRGVRQGARFDTIGIHFYFVSGSSEQHRLDKIERKRGIMLALYEDGDLDTNTVQADEVEADDDIADSFLTFAPPEVAEKIKAMQAEEKEDQARQRAASARKAANIVLGDAIAARRRWMRAIAEGAENATTLGDDFRRLEARIGTFPASLWTGRWHELAELAIGHAEERGVYIPEDGGYPLVPGLFLSRDDDDWTMLVTAAGPEGAFGVANRTYAELASLPPFKPDSTWHWLRVRREIPPASFYSERWPTYTMASSLYEWNAEKWRTHGPEWQEAQWPKLVEASERNGRSHGVYVQRGWSVPVGRPSGTLRLLTEDYVKMADVYPPTPTGYAELIAVAGRQREVGHRKLAAAVRGWFGIDLPLGTVGAALKEAE